jgi:hypothetical protein
VLWQCELHCWCPGIKRCGIEILRCVIKNGPKVILDDNGMFYFLSFISNLSPLHLNLCTSPMSKLYVESLGILEG